MNLFRSYTYSWKQIGVLKVALLSIGALIGSHWAETVNNYTEILLVIAVVSSIYIMYASFKQA